MEEMEPRDKKKKKKKDSMRLKTEKRVQKATVTVISWHGQQLYHQGTSKYLTAVIVTAIDSNLKYIRMGLLCCYVQAIIGTVLV